jgi:hypothetical protein
MRIAVVLAVVLSPLISFGQSKELPDVLKPDPDLVILAESSGFEVAKILPRGTFAGPFNAYKDEENPLGIREGGSYYSFTTRNHSYNKIPQIGLEKGMLKVGFYGLSYGFVTALGDIPLELVELDTFPGRYLADYKPPYLYSDIREEQKRAWGFTYESFKFVSRIKATAQATYLVRAISFDEADKLVAFKILKIDDDGAITIGWRSLKDFEVPRYAHETDDVLREKVAALLKNDRYVGTQFSVSKGVITVRGFPRNSVNQLTRDLQELRPRSITMSHAPIE